MKLYIQLTKLGIAIFAVLMGWAGYLWAVPVESVPAPGHFLKFMGGLYLLSSGSLALNQWQERHRDRLMKRTQQRPLVQGRVRPGAVLILSLGLIVAGSHYLGQVAPAAAGWGWLTVILYNGVYTFLKSRSLWALWVGALAGSGPILLGYAASGLPQWWTDWHLWYLWWLLFIWQIPHFLVLLMRYSEDYQEAGFVTHWHRWGPVKTLRLLGLTFLIYLFSAAVQVWFFPLSGVTIGVLLMMVLGLWFWMQWLKDTQRGFLPFFLWLNFSVLVFVLAPVAERWRLIWEAQRGA